MKTLTNTEGFAVEEGKEQRILSRKLLFESFILLCLQVGFLAYFQGKKKSHGSLCDEVVLSQELNIEKEPTRQMPEQRMFEEERL